MSALMEGRSLSKAFGGLTAVKEVDFHLADGEIVGLIGPNGAGKTTLFNIITGIFPPDTGSLTFDGQKLTGRKPFEVCRLGVARTFQIVRPFLKMTCLENVLVGIIGREKQEENRTGKKEEAGEILNITGLAHHEGRLAKDLTLIEKKRLEVARALATRPRLILLDEVLAGLNLSEMQQALELIEKIRSQFKITIFWIEHVMGAIMKASDRIIVLDQGQKIKEGEPGEVVTDPRVIEAYLGESDA